MIKTFSIIVTIKMILSRAFNRTLILTPLILAVGCDSQPPSYEGLSPAAQPDSGGETTAAIDYPKAGMGTTPGEWDAYGADIGSTKYTPLDQINADNIDSLEIVWRRPALDEYYVNINPRQRYSNTWNAAPIVKNGVAYVTNGVGLVAVSYTHLTLPTKA